MDESQRHFTISRFWNWDKVSQVALPLVKSDAMLVVLVLFLALTGTVLSEKIPIGGGFGFDGSFYGVAAMVPSIQDLQALDAYHMMRTLPSIVVRSFLLATGQDLIAPNVIAGFALLNIVLLTLGALIWIRICRLARFN